MAGRVACLYMGAGRQLHSASIQTPEAEQERRCGTRPAREAVRLPSPPDGDFQQR